MSDATATFRIWVDADACPGVIKEILFRVADRLKIPVTLVANTLLRIPPSPYIKTIRVAAGFDEADNEIVRLVAPGDLVVTADIPLASEVLGKHAHALNPRGEFYTTDNIEQHLRTRAMLDEMRAGGMDTGGPAPFAQRDRQAFANQLDRHLAQMRTQR